MQKAYLAVSLSHRPQLENIIQIIHQSLSEAAIDLFVFVDHYHFNSEQETEMMQTAFREIEESDILIAEVSAKAIGVGVEVGYAVAKNIPVWYLRNRTAPHSSTLSGAAHEHILYKDEQDLAAQLRFILQKDH